MTDPRAGTGVFHGWKLIGALSVILFFAAGGSIYVFPVFIESFQAEFGWSMTQISSGAALFAIVMGLSNPVVGTLFARWGARADDADGRHAAGPDSLGYAALSISGCCTRSCWSPASPWPPPPSCPRRPSSPTGSTSSGAGRWASRCWASVSGGFLLPPLNEFLIRLLGWRLTWVVFCVILVLIVIPLIAVFRADPAFRPRSARPTGRPRRSEGRESGSGQRPDAKGRHCHTDILAAGRRLPAADHRSLGTELPLRPLRQSGDWIHLPAGRLLLRTGRRLQHRRPALCSAGWRIDGLPRC